MSATALIHVHGARPSASSTAGNVCTKAAPFDPTASAADLLVIYHPDSYQDANAWRCPHCGTTKACR